jgi:hypothetical protein
MKLFCLRDFRFLTAGDEATGKKLKEKWLCFVGNVKIRVFFLFE